MPSALYPHGPGLPQSSPWKSVQALWHPGLGVHTRSNAGQRRTRCLRPPLATRSTGRHPGTPPHPLVTYTYPSHIAQTGRRPHVPESTGTCLGEVCAQVPLRSERPLQSRTLRRGSVSSHYSILHSTTSLSHANTHTLTHGAGKRASFLPSLARRRKS